MLGFRKYAKQDLFTQMEQVRKSKPDSLDNKPEDNNQDSLGNVGASSATEQNGAKMPSLLPKKAPVAPISTQKPAGTRLDETYKRWSQDPQPHNMSEMVRAAQPMINSAMTSYAGGNNPVLRGQAKRIAIQAIKTYDPNSDATLQSWIMLNLQGLRRKSAKLSPITAPERVKLDHGHIFRAKQEFIAATGDEPSIEELSHETGLSPKRIAYVNKTMKTVANEGQYLHGETEDEDSDSFVPGIESNSWQQIWIEYVYRDLDDINKKIFNMRMGRGKYKDKPLSVQEIARQLGISAAAVSQRSNRIAEMLSRGDEMKDKL